MEIKNTHLMTCPIILEYIVVLFKPNWTSLQRISYTEKFLNMLFLPVVETN